MLELNELHYLLQNISLMIRDLTSLFDDDLTVK